MRLFCAILLSLPLVATNHYIRAGGAGNGSDWTNACGGFSGSCAIASLVRGDTYFIGNGTITSSATNWNTTASGTTVITIQKATIASHGTATGWSDSYAAQAVFNERNTFSTNYWVFNGVVGDYNSGGIGSYGFQFKYSVGGAGALFNADNITLQYIDCSGYTGTGDYNYPDQAKCIEAYGGNNWLVSHVAMHGCESCVQGGGSAWTLEYCYIYNSRSIAANFHNNVFYASSITNGTIRYNTVWDYNAEGWFVTGFDGAVNGLKIYGNVMWDTGVQSEFPRGVELRQDFSYTNIIVVNNTFATLDTGMINRTGETGNTCTGCVIRDNISYQAGNGALTPSTNDNNTDDSTNRFVSASTHNYRLTGALAGVSLAPEYNQDMDGNTRGADGVWDRGAYEFVAGGTVPTITTTSPLTAGTVGVAYSITFTATGDTPITWTATGVPGGLSLSSGGVLSGTPTTPGTSTINVTATNATGTQAGAPTGFSITINAAATASRVASGNVTISGKVQ